MDADGNVIQVKNPQFLIHLPVLQGAFRKQFRDRLEAMEWKVNPVVWTKEWGVHISILRIGRGGGEIPRGLCVADSDWRWAHRLGDARDGDVSVERSGQRRASHTPNATRRRVRRPVSKTCPAARVEIDSILW